MILPPLPAFPDSHLGKLFGHGSDVVGLEPTTAAYVSDAHVVRLTREAVHVPARADPRLQRCNNAQTVEF